MEISYIILNKLEKVQYKAWFAITGAIPRTPIQKINDELGYKH